MAEIEVTALLAAVRQCVTVVEPGEVLAVRVSEDVSDEYLSRLGERARDISERLGVVIVFAQGAEFARLKASPGGAP